MSSTYFENFPQTLYNGQVSRNIILRAKFFKEVLDNYAAFYPYTVKDDERADMIAQFYYGDWRYDWLVYFSNEMVDPYFDWPLNQAQFDNFIIKKYGSHEISLDTVHHYEYNNHAVLSVDDDSIDLEGAYLQDYKMSPITYSFLPTAEKGLWRPVHAYEYEFQKNEAKRNIKLLDNRLTKQVEKELANIFGSRG